MSDERVLTPGRAGREAVQWEMQNDDKVFFMGEDVVHLGGVYNTATDLAKEFPDRIIDTPISESGFFGIAAGAAMEGMRPIVELAFADFLLVCMDPIANIAAKTHYMSDGQLKVPMVMLVGAGGSYMNGATQSQCLYSVLPHFPGLKVVIPSNAHDAKGLMHAAIRDDNPVVILYHKATMGVGFLGAPIPTTMTPVPEEPYEVPLDKANICREGDDVTLVGLGWTVHHCLEAADKLAEAGVSAEVVDLRCLKPLDKDTIVTSVKKTGRLIVVDEDYLSYGVTAEVVASAVEADSSIFKAPPKRIAYPDVPPPAAKTLEGACLPSVDKILAAVEEVM